MLSGKYRFNINEKGRLFVPAKMRDNLGERFMLSKSVTDKCLTIYPIEKWENMLVEFEKSATATRVARRRIFGDAEEMIPDKQGRIIVPQELRDFAGLSGEVIIIGIGSSAEVWDAKTFEACEENVDNEELEKLLIELGL